MDVNIQENKDTFNLNITSILQDYNATPCLGFILYPNAILDKDILMFYDDIGYINFENSKNDFDLFMFMGQSNMAGRGITNASHPEKAPTVLGYKGSEYRVISNPTVLNAIVEPFGKDENKTGGISESSKTGSMVSSFVNAYYNVTNTPIIAVSASQGGTKISQWQPDGILLTDAVQRLDDTIAFCNENDISIRHKYMV